METTGTTTTAPLSLAHKLAQVAHACGYVQKDKRNDFHRYSYASAAAVLAKVNEALAAQGCCSTVVPEVVSDHEVRNAKGNVERLVTVRVTITIHDGGSSATLATVGLGSGQDNGDKAVMKAQTAAIKYAWMLCLNISTGDDPEADPTVDERAAQEPRSKPAPTGAAPTGPARPGRADEPGAALGSFLARADELELPGEAVALWIKHRDALKDLPSEDREGAWKALCGRVEKVGKMKNAKVWLKRAIAEEDARKAAMVSDTYEPTGAQ